MKAADRDLRAGRAQALRNIQRARKLVRLHADQADQPAAVAHFGGDPLRPYARVGLVDGDDVEILAERPAGAAILGQPMHHRERVRGYGRAQPLDDIAVVVVMRRLDEIEPKPSPHRTSCALNGTARRSMSSRKLVD